MINFICTLLFFGNAIFWFTLYHLSFAFLFCMANNMTQRTNLFVCLFVVSKFSTKSIMLPFLFTFYFCMRVNTFAGNSNYDSFLSSSTLSYHFHGYQQLSNGTTTSDYCTDSMMLHQQQHQNDCITVIPLSLSTDTTITDSNTITTTAVTSTTTITATTTPPILMISLTKKHGIFPKLATNIMRAWLFHHLTVSSVPELIRLDDVKINQK